MKVIILWQRGDDTGRIKEVLRAVEGLPYKPECQIISEREYLKEIAPGWWGRHIGGKAVGDTGLLVRLKGFKKFIDRHS